MSSAVKQVIASMTSNVKIADLQRDIHEPAKGDGLTTEFGVHIESTDDW